MMWKARTLRLSPTSQVTGSTPVVVENGMHQPGFPLVHGPERLGGGTKVEDVSAQLRQRQLGQQRNGLLAAPRPAPDPGQPGRHGGYLRAANRQTPPVEGAAEWQNHGFGTEPRRDQQGPLVGQHVQRHRWRIRATAGGPDRRTPRSA